MRRENTPPPNSPNKPFMAYSSNNSGKLYPSLIGVLALAVCYLLMTPPASTGQDTRLLFPTT